MICLAQAGISVVTSEGEKTLTIQNSKQYKEIIHAEKLAKKTGNMREADQTNFAVMSPPETLGGQDFQDVMGQFSYREQPDLEVQDLNDWEKTHLQK